MQQRRRIHTTNAQSRVPVRRTAMAALAPYAPDVQKPLQAAAVGNIAAVVAVVLVGTIVAWCV
jgi:hypothetical protein